VKDLTKFLDPSGLGVISFEDFHRGISAISNGEPQLYSYSPGDGAVGCPEEYDEVRCPFWSTCCVLISQRYLQCEGHRLNSPCSLTLPAVTHRVACRAIITTLRAPQAEHAGLADTE
ncbi:hypothetical protein XENOCAPTIV_011848, partial [Xenoophorus captivus]